MIDLNWFGLCLIGLYFVSILITVSNIGKPRKAIDQGEAVFIIILNTLIIVGLLFIGTTG